MLPFYCLFLPHLGHLRGLTNRNEALIRLDSPLTTHHSPPASFTPFTTLSTCLLLPNLPSHTQNTLPHSISPITYHNRPHQYQCFLRPSSGFLSNLLTYLDDARNIACLPACLSILSVRPPYPALYSRHSRQAKTSGRTNVSLYHTYVHRHISGFLLLVESRLPPFYITITIFRHCTSNTTVHCPLNAETEC